MHRIPGTHSSDKIKVVQLMFELYSALTVAAVCVETSCV